MSKTRLFFLIAILWVLAGCSFFVPQAREPQIAASEIKTQGESFAHIDNETGEIINALYYSACDAESWGVNRLTPSQAILDGATYFGSLPPGCWDFKVETESGEIYDQYQADLSIGESFSWVVN